jgi:hypothetical protein
VTIVVLLYEGEYNRQLMFYCMRGNTSDNCVILGGRIQVTMVVSLYEGKYK